MKDLKMTPGWTSGAMSVALTSIQLAGVQPVENLLSLLEVSGLFTPTVIKIRVLPCSVTHSNIQVMSALQ